MKPADTTRSGSCSATASVRAASQSSRVGKSLDAQGEGGQTHSFRAGGSLDIGTVRPHGHDLGPVGWIRARVEQRL